MYRSSLFDPPRVTQLFPSKRTKKAFLRRRKEREAEKNTARKNMIYFKYMISCCCHRGCFARVPARTPPGCSTHPRRLRSRAAAAVTPSPAVGPPVIAGGVAAGAGAGAAGAAATVGGAAGAAGPGREGGRAPGRSTRDDEYDIISYSSISLRRPPGCSAASLSVFFFCDCFSSSGREPDVIEAWISLPRLSKAGQSLGQVI